LHGKVYLVLNAIYEFLLRQLHLPKPLFPRDL
jgi:hypothetical protein